MIFVEPVANGQTDLGNNRLIFIPSGWADGYFEICRIKGGAKW